MESPQPTRRNRAWFVIAALIVVVGFELGARLLGPNTNQIPQVLDQHRENLSKTEPDWLFVGDSSVGAAVDPLAFDAATGETSYNLWQATASMRTVERVLLDFGLEQSRPSVVVIGVTGRMFNGAASEEQMARQETLEASLPWQRVVEPTFYTSIESVAAELSALVRHRAALSRPSDWYRALTVDQRFESDERGHLTFPEQNTVTNPVAGHLEGEREALEGYVPGTSEFDALVRVVTELDRRGMDVYVVEIPVYEPVYDRLYPGGAADVAAFEAELERRMGGLPAELVDMTSFGSEPSLFADENHLNATAARTFSTELAGRIVAG